MPVGRSTENARAFVANAIVIKPNPAGIPSRYWTLDVLQAFNVEYTRARAAIAERASTPAIRAEGIRQPTLLLFPIEYLIVVSLQITGRGMETESESTRTRTDPEYVREKPRRHARG